MGEEESSMLDTVFSFFEEAEGTTTTTTSSSPEWEEFPDDDADRKDVSESAADKAAFWDSQHQLLHNALGTPRSSLETKVCRTAEEAVRKIREEGGGVVCSCQRKSTSDGIKDCCRGCFLKSIAHELRNAGFDCGICRSKWRSSPDIPSGEHSYLDVVHKPSNAARKSPTRVVVEPNFRAEFEMARASERYNALVRTLPEVFVGRPEKLKGVIKAMCSAAKKCMKENNMHMGPWRKYKYMQAKWLASSYKRIIVSPEAAEEPEQQQIPVAEGTGGVDYRRPGRPRASLLTFDLSDTSPAAAFRYSAAVQVV